MKLISLNTWGGRYFDPLIAFIKLHSDADVFCFQEMQDTTSKVKQYGNIRVNLLSEVKQILPNFQVFYFPVVKSFDDNACPTDFESAFGSALFIKDSIGITALANYIVSENQPFPQLKKDFSNLPTPLQYAGFTLDSKEFAVFNFHGTPFPSHKIDTNLRLKEVLKTKEIINQEKGAKILVGDFNLLPQTESIKIFETDMRNLISDHLPMVLEFT